MRKFFSWILGGILLLVLMAMGRVDPGLNAQLLHVDYPLPSFDVATVRPSKADSLRTVRLAGELKMFNVTAGYLIEQAYNIPWTDGSKDRLRGGPGWIDSDHFDVEAKVSPEDAAILEQLPEAQRRTQMNLRLQALLADRFKLRAHFESRQETVFAIMTGRNGPKLVAAASNAENLRDQGISVRYTGDAAQMTAKNVSIGELATWLAGYSEMGGHTVVDQTGLTRRYDFVLNWTRERSLANGGQTGEAGSPASSGGPALFTALQEQLGLKLVNTKAPVEIVVVDSIEHPTEN